MAGQHKQLGIEPIANGFRLNYAEHFLGEHVTAWSVWANTTARADQWYKADANSYEHEISAKVAPVTMLRRSLPDAARS